MHGTLTDEARAARLGISVVDVRAVRATYAKAMAGQPRAAAVTGAKPARPSTNPTSAPVVPAAPSAAVRSGDKKKRRREEAITAVMASYRVDHDVVTDMLFGPGTDHRNNRTRGPADAD